MKSYFFNGDSFTVGSRIGNLIRLIESNNFPKHIKITSLLLGRPSVLLCWKKEGCNRLCRKGGSEYLSEVSKYSKQRLLQHTPWPSHHRLFPCRFLYCRRNRQSPIVTTTSTQSQTIEGSLLNQDMLLISREYKDEPWRDQSLMIFSEIMMDLYLSSLNSCLVNICTFSTPFLPLPRDQPRIVETSLTAISRVNTIRHISCMLLTVEARHQYLASRLVLSWTKHAGSVV